MSPNGPSGECELLLEALRSCMPAWLLGRPLQMASSWQGDRLHVDCQWTEVDESSDTASSLTLQFLPRERQLWIGHLEIPGRWRGKGVGRLVVQHLENACQLADVHMIRMFACFEALGFWTQLGYNRESGGRFLQKIIPRNSTP